MPAKDGHLPPRTAAPPPCPVRKNYSRIIPSEGWKSCKNKAREKILDEFDRTIAAAAAGQQIMPHYNNFHFPGQPIAF